MKNNTIGFLFLFGFIVVIAFSSAAFIIPEGRQVVVTQFGKPVKSVSEPGLHFKTPFIQDVRMIDLRVLAWDGFPNQITTKDKKYIEVDTTARWKIVDPLKFIQTVQNERQARSKLDAILDGITRDVISKNILVEAVRNSNQIFEVIEQKKAAAKKRADENTNLETETEVEEVFGEIEEVSIGREELSRRIIDLARVELKKLGIELIDVQLKRISFEDQVEKKVYQRMISERKRVAAKIRSYGEGEMAKIQGKTQKELQLITSGAYRKVQEIKGKAEASAIEIYAAALGQDPEFFRFIRTLEAYEKSLPKDSKFLFSSGSKFWKVLKTGESK